MRHKTKKEDKQYKKHNTENYKETSPKKTQNIGMLELLYHETCFNRIVEFTVVWNVSVNVYSNKRYCSINLK